MLRFDDGVNVDTSGELRTLQLHDGLYVVGQGCLCPVRDMNEARDIMRELRYYVCADCDTTFQDTDPKAEEHHCPHCGCGIHRVHTPSQDDEEREFLLEVAVVFGLPKESVDRYINKMNTPPDIEGDMRERVEDMDDPRLDDVPDDVDDLPIDDDEAESIKGDIQYDEQKDNWDDDIDPMLSPAGWCDV